MDKQPVYIKFNDYRKPEFNIATEIVNIDGKNVVYKFATNNESKAFLKQIQETHDLLSKSNLPLEINKIKTIDKNRLEIEYIKGVTLLSELTSCAKTKEECIEIFRNFSKLLDTFPSENTYLSKDFENVFGKSTSKKKYDVVIPGVLDLHLDNIIRRKDGKLILIDLEWTFKFGIPKRYILYRTISGAYAAVRDALSKVITIEDLEEESGFSEEEVRECLNWEVHFQEYVTGNKRDIEVLLQVRGQTEVKSFVIERKRILETEKEGLEMKLETLEKERKELEMKLGTLEKKRKELEIKLITIEKEKGALTPDALEFRELKKTRIWKALSMHRKLKKYTKNFFKKV